MTGILMTQENLPIILIERCNLCGQCVALCPEDALVMTETGPGFREPNTCTYCTECEAICPQGAIRAPLTVTWESDSN